MNKRQQGQTNPESYPDQEFALLVGRIVGASGLIVALIGTFMADISLEVLGVMCGFFAYALGSRRLGVAAIIISTLVLVLLLTGLRGYLPSIEPPYLGSVNLSKDLHPSW